MTDGRRRRRTARALRRAATAAAVLALAATGCSSDGDGSGPESGSGPEAGTGSARTLAVLERVRHQGDPPAQLTAYDAARVAELVAADPRRFQVSADLGLPLLTDFRLPDHRYGLAPEDADLAVSVRTGDGTYGRWWGTFDPRTVGGHLADAGFPEREEGGGTVWETGRGLSLGVTEEEVRWHSADAAESGSADGEPLAERPEYRRLTACLGEGYRADFLLSTEDGEVHGHAIGQRAESPEETSAVLCALAADAEHADRIVEAFEEVVDEKSGYDGAEVGVVDDDGPLVRVTVPDGPGDAAGRLVTSHLDLSMALSRLRDPDAASP